MPNYYRCAKCNHPCELSRSAVRGPCPCGAYDVVPARLSTLTDQIQAEHVNRAVNFFEGDKRLAAACLEISLATLYRILKNYKGVAKE